MSQTDPEASYVARKGKRMFSYKYHFTIDRKESQLARITLCQTQHKRTGLLCGMGHS